MPHSFSKLDVTRYCFRLTLNLKSLRLALGLHGCSMRKAEQVARESAQSTGKMVELIVQKDCATCQQTFRVVPLYHKRGG